MEEMPEQEIEKCTSFQKEKIFPEIKTIKLIWSVATKTISRYLNNLEAFQKWLQLASMAALRIIHNKGS